MRQLRSLEDLSPTDLMENSVWVWAYDEEEGDELSVEPHSVQILPEEGEFHVACSLVANTGRQLVGILSVTDGIPDPDSIAVVESKQRHWHLHSAPPQRDRLEFQEHFGGGFNEIFPVTWQSAVPMAGGLHPGGVIEQRVWLEVVTAKCTFCGGVLRSNRAKQCPNCLRSWA